jgi:prevent-host-death family protein
MSDMTTPEKQLPTKIGAFAAKTELSKLLRQARAGKSFIITQRGTPVAELRPIQKTGTQNNKQGGKATKRGDMKGKLWMADDFCDPIEEMREYME